jgi:hypothetical protein
VIDLLSIPWDESRAAQKGRLGEAAIKDFMRSAGIESWSPAGDGKHSIDFAAISSKDGLYFADAKQYARRTYYADTGLDLRHYECYCRLEIRTGKPVMIFWADEDMELIYGGWLQEIAAPGESVYSKRDGRMVDYPWIQPSRTGSKVYFPLKRMRVFARLANDKANAMRDLAKRSYEYPSRGQGNLAL